MNKLKLLVFAVIISNAAHLFSQKALALPNQDQYFEYLLNRGQEIEEKMIQLFQEGKLNAYQTDSLKTKYFDDENWAQRLNGKRLGYFFFINAYQGAFDSISSTSYMKSVCPVFQPIYAGHFATPQPLCYFDAKELERILSPDDFKFLRLIYNFGKDSKHNLNFYEDEEPYFLRLVEKLSLVKCDSSLFNELSQTLATNYCFIVGIQYYSTIENRDQYWVQDEKNKRRIPLHEIGKTFYQKIPYFISTDPDDPTVGFDTIVMQPIVVNKFDEAFFDDKTGQVIHFIVRFEYGELQQGVLHIPRHNFLLNEPSSVLLWLTEDYYRWRARNNK